MEPETIVGFVIVLLCVAGILITSIRARRARDKRDQSYRMGRALFDKSKVAKTQSVPGFGQITRANRAFCEMVGYSPSELLTLTWRELSHPEDHGRASEPVNEMIDAAKLGQDPDPVSFFVRYVAKDGSICPAYVSVTYVADEREDDPGILLAEIQSTDEFIERHRELVHEGLDFVTGPIHL